MHVKLKYNESLLMQKVPISISWSSDQKNKNTDHIEQIYDMDIDEHCSEHNQIDKDNMIDYRPKQIPNKNVSIDVDKKIINVDVDSTEEPFLSNIRNVISIADQITTAFADTFNGRC